MPTSFYIHFLQFIVYIHCSSNLIVPIILLIYLLKLLKLFFSVCISERTSAAMKVVSVSAIIEKYDINDISDFDITYMNKLNESLNATSDLTFKSRENKFNGTADKFEETILLNGYLTEGMKISATNRKNYDCSNVNGHLDEDNRISDENLKSENQSDPESLSNDLEVCGKPCEKVENLSAGDSGLESSISSWDKSVSEIKEHAYKKLEAELQNLREILKLRDEEVINLRKMRQDGDKELLELTASLFEVCSTISLFN